MSRPTFDYQGLFACVKTGNFEELQVKCKPWKKALQKRKQLTSTGLSSVTDETGQTLLHAACEAGHLAIVKFLLDQLKLNVNTQDRNGWTALHSACKAGHLDVTDYLLSYGAEAAVTTFDSDTPLHYFARMSDRDSNPHLYNYTMERLVKLNSSLINLQNKHGETALHSACLNGRKKLVEILIRSGAALNRCTRRSNDQPIHSAIRARKLEILKLLAENGADLTAECRDGDCLTLAKKFSSPDLVTYLEETFGCKGSNRPLPTPSPKPTTVPVPSTLPTTHNPAVAQNGSRAPTVNYPSSAGNAAVHYPPSNVYNSQNNNAYGANNANRMGGNSLPQPPVNSIPGKSPLPQTTPNNAGLNGSISSKQAAPGQATYTGPQPNSKQQQVLNWLKHIKMEYVYDSFMSDGWDCLDFILGIERSDLAALKLPYSDQTAILVAVAHLPHYMSTLAR